MPLWNIYHPQDAFSDEDKFFNDTATTEIYTR